MKKKSFIYSDLTKKQLQHLKGLYIQKKVDSMSNKELKEFVLEIITHQITDTIDREEEMEAWREISNFFGTEFEMIISEIQKKFNDDWEVKDKVSDHQKHRKELLEKNCIEKEKTDMWAD